MTFPKYQDLEKKYEKLKADEIVADIEKEIFVLNKTLFDFRIQRATKKTLEPHMLIQTKRRIAQLEYKKNIVLKEQKHSAKSGEERKTL